MTLVKHVRNRTLHHNYAERLNKYIWHCSFRGISLQTALKTASLNRSEQNSYQMPSHFAAFSPTSPFTSTLSFGFPLRYYYLHGCVNKIFLTIWKKHGKRLYFHRRQFHLLQLAKTEIWFKVIKSTKSRFFEAHIHSSCWKGLT